MNLQSFSAEKVMNCKSYHAFFRILKMKSFSLFALENGNLLEMHAGQTTNIACLPMYSTVKRCISDRVGRYAVPY